MTLLTIYRFYDWSTYYAEADIGDCDVSPLPYRRYVGLRLVM